MGEMILCVVETIFWYVYTICIIVYIVQIIDRQIDFERCEKKHEQRFRELGVKYEKLER